MIEILFTKENIAIFGVVVLFLWRIIDFIIRQKKKRENELEKLAFEMAKFRIGDNNDYQSKSLFPYYLFYLDILERGIRPYDEESYELIKEYDDDIVGKINRLDQILIKLTEIEQKLSDDHEITVSDLFDRNITWGFWWRDTKKLLKKTFRNKTNFRSFR